MPTLSLQGASARDLPACFPGRPCVDCPPAEADAITIASTLTPASQAIGVGCFAVLAVALVLLVIGLRPQSPPRGPSFRTLTQSAALAVSPSA